MADNLIKIICPRCGRSTSGVVREIEYTIRAGKYICCMHCGLKLENPFKDIKECMDERCYKRENGSMKQIRNK